MSHEIGDPVEHRVGTVAKWGPECYIWDMIKSNAPAAGSTAHGLNTREFETVNNVNC